VKTRQKKQGLVVYFLVIGLMLALSPITLNTVFAAPPAGSDWTLTWYDEFNGDSLDPNKWDWGVLSWGGQWQAGNYVSWTTAEDSYLEDGSLILRSRKATGEEFGGQPWSQGFMYGTEWSFYGYVEIRAKYPLGNGIWGGLWMLHYGWPPEFDIAEYFGTDDKMHQGICYKFGGLDKWEGLFIEDEDFDEWHLYGLEWYPGGVKFYMDGELKHTTEVWQVPHLPMYTILQSGMDATYDANTPNPNYYEVDYIRWYKNDDLPLYQSNDYLPSIIDVTSDSVTTTGTWYEYEGNPVWMGHELYSVDTNAVTEFTFTGTKVAYFSAKRNDLGYVEILLDDELVDTVDCYNSVAQYHQKLYQSSELDSGEHTLGIRVKGTKNPLSSGVYVLVDAFRYSTISSAYCGDGSCDPNTNNETNCNCSADCGTPDATETSCTDEVDNDCDGSIDCEDSDCDSDEACDVCDNDDVCEEGESCTNCPNDCDSRTTGPPAGRFCCGNGEAESAEGDGTICDGNY